MQVVAEAAYLAGSSAWIVPLSGSGCVGEIADARMLASIEPTCAPGAAVSVLEYHCGT